MSLKDKVAIITGGGRGIGRAIALVLAKEGVNVVICARTQSDIDSVAEEVHAANGHALAVHADISRESEVKLLVSKTIDRFGRVDILVNNAGIGAFARVEDLATEDFDAMWGINLRGVFLCTREVLPFMNKQREGDILNISSLAGRNAFVRGAGYCATKWALIGFARCLMLEVREHNIRVVTICPGSVETGFGDRSAESPRSSGNIPKAEDIANVVLHTLMMPRHVMVSEVDIRPTNPKK